MKKNYRWELDYSVSAGETYEKFLQGLKETRLLGNCCPKCGNVFVPAKPFCDHCFEKPDKWLEMPQEGTLEAFTVCYQKFANLPDPPYVIGVIKIGNSATSFIHFISGITYNKPEEIPDKLQIGMLVKPKWANDRTGDILDIDSFIPA